MTDPNYIGSALQLASGINRGGTQGAQSALQGAAGLSSGMLQAPQLQGVSNYLGGTGNALGIANGIEQGGVSGIGSSAANAAALAGRSGLFDPSTNQALNTGAGDLVSGLNIYRGIQQGGVGGYGGAAVNAAKLGSNLGAFGGASGAVGTAAGMAAIPLSLYNEVNNWQSGNTGSDALAGASTGAAIGSVIPGIGTLIGGLVGGAAGALSSAFGPGKVDPETTGYKGFEQAYKKNPEVASVVQNPFLDLAGVMDQRNSSLPIYQAYGRMGEDKFTKDMTGLINSSLQNGTISKDSSSADIMNKVVNPWIGSMGTGWNKDPAAASEEASTDALVQQMVDQYIHGQQGNWKSIGGDYHFGNVKAFGAAEGGSVRHYDDGGGVWDSGLSPDIVTITSPDMGGGGSDDGSQPYVDPTYGLSQQWNNDNALQNISVDDPSVLGSVNSALNPSFLSQLGSALQNPKVLGGLLGGGLGLAASMGPGNKFSFNPPAPFANVPHNYGNFSAQPRTQTHPNIDYAHAAETGPVPQFYTPSPQQLSPLQTTAMAPPQQPAAAPPQAPPSMGPIGGSGLPVGAPAQAPAPPPAAVNQFLAQLQAQHPVQPAAPPASRGQSIIDNIIAQGGFAGLGMQAQMAGRMAGRMAGGGEVGHSPLLLGHQLAQGQRVQGAGDGTSDDIPAMLSDGEYVIPAHVVSALGNGSNKAGAQALDDLQKRVRLRTGQQMAAGKHPARIGKPESFMKAAK